MLGLILLAAEAAARMAQATAPTTHAALDHIGLSVTNPDASAEFYERVLGLRPVAQNASPSMRWLQGDRFQLHLIPGRTKPVDTATDTHFAFRVQSLAEELQILDQNRIQWTDSDGVQRKVTTRFDGVLQAYFHDPDGYLVEVNQAPK